MLLAEEESPGAVGTAKIFASHTWRAPFRDLVAALAHVVDDKDYVWIDERRRPALPGVLPGLFPLVETDPSAPAKCERSFVEPIPDSRRPPAFNASTMPSIFGTGAGSEAAARRARKSA